MTDRVLSTKILSDFRPTPESSTQRPDWPSAWPVAPGRPPSPHPALRSDRLHETNPRRNSRPFRTVFHTPRTTRPPSDRITDRTDRVPEAASARSTGPEKSGAHPDTCLSNPTAPYRKSLERRASSRIPASGPRSFSATPPGGRTIRLAAVRPALPDCPSETKPGKEARAGTARFRRPSIRTGGGCCARPLPPRPSPSVS